MKGLILYTGKYGATRQYAEWLGEMLMLPVQDIGEISPAVLTRFDYLLLGSPVYMGGTLHKGWLKRHSEVLQTKKLFHFIVCGTPPSDTQRLNEVLYANIPAALLSPGSAWFLRGRVIKNKLSWFHRFMLWMGSRLEKDPNKKRSMRQDFDDVKKENLESLAGAVNLFTTQLKKSSQIAELNTTA